MKEKIQEILDSDLLENYLTGACDQAEEARVERYLALYPEVRTAYEELQENQKIPSICQTRCTLWR